MTKNSYTQEQVDFVSNLVKKKKLSITEATRKMCGKFGIEYKEHIGRKFREKLQKQGLSQNVRVIEDTEEFKKARTKNHDSSKQRFIFTWAQNSCNVHEQFLSNIESYANFIDAEIVVIAGRYKNPTSLSASKQIKSTEVWNKRVQPYLSANRHNIHEFLTVLGDVKTQPTATTPLTGFNGLSGLGSSIVGHPKLHLKTLPVLEGYPHKMLMTTGAVTLPDYTDSKAGVRGKFHHQFGFVIVELDGSIYHTRQVAADKDGNFYDLFYKINAGVVSEITSCPAMVFGDVHLEEVDKEALSCSFSLARKINPNIIVLNDVIEAGAISHHEQNNPFRLLQREKDGSWSLKREIKRMKKWFRKNDAFNYLVVASNHSDFIDRWLMNSDWRKTLNKELYLKYANITAKGKAPKGIVAYELDKHFSDFVTTTGTNDSYRVLGWELSQHGHVGSSGSRPSPTQFKNLSTKLITAHTHSPLREDNHVCVGTLTKLRMDYNKGASAWCHSNAIIHPNGKVQQVHIIRNKYTTFI